MIYLYLMGLLLKHILMESKLYSYTIDELLENFLKFEDQTLVFLDTETTGLDPSKFYSQLSQISVLVVDGSTWEIIEKYSAKIKMRPAIQQLMDDPKSKAGVAFEKEKERWLNKYKKPLSSPKDLLSTSKYFGSDSYLDEKTALSKLVEIISKYKNVVIVAHNSKFDINMIQSGLRINGLPPLKKIKVLDTVKIARYFFIPALVSLENNKEATDFLSKLLAKTKYKSYVTALGRLAHVFKVSAENWHDAEADTYMLFQVLQKMIEFLKKNRHLDIRKYQGTQAKRFRHL